eukprot:1214573-Prymnesium_polylepis.1
MATPDEPDRWMPVDAGDGHAIDFHTIETADQRAVRRCIILCVAPDAQHASLQCEYAERRNFYTEYVPFGHFFGIRWNTTVFHDRPHTHRRPTTTARCSGRW